MGTPIPPPFKPEPVAPGIKCPNCWGPGEAFGNIPTPKILYVKVSGINKGPNWFVGAGEPPNGTVTVTQDIAAPCVYRGTADGFDATLNFLFGNSGFIIFVLPSNITPFLGLGNDTCDPDFTNTKNDHFTGGTARVIFPATT